MRPPRLVVGSVLTAALALVALPGFAGSRVPDPIEPLPVGAFQPLDIPANAAMTATGSVAAPDSAFVSEGALGTGTAIVEPPLVQTGPVVSRPKTDQRSVGASSLRTGALSAAIPGNPKRTLSGNATFYDNGTTAMRLPRGTIVKICGKGGCIVRVVNDWGPRKKTRVVDLYRPDFFAICGCPSYSGVTKVTVYVY